MASLVHPIQKYKVHFVHNRNAGPPATHTRTRFIQLSCTAPDNLKSSFVNLSFIADAQWASTGEITKTSANGYRVDAKIPVGEFAAYYDVLRNEKPVSLWVDYGSELGLNQTVPIINFSLFTGEEPLGEGPQDTSN